MAKYKVMSGAPRPAHDQQAYHAEIGRLSQAAFIAGNLINPPGNDLGPDRLDAAIRIFED